MQCKGGDTWGLYDKVPHHASTVAHLSHPLSHSPVIFQTHKNTLWRLVDLSELSTGTGKGNRCYFNSPQVLPSPQPVPAGSLPTAKLTHW